MKQSKDHAGEEGANMRDNADSEMNLAHSILKRRRALKLTQENLSDISGVSLRLIHEIEHGKDTVQLGNLIKILSSLGLHLELTVGAGNHITIDPNLTPSTWNKQ